MYPDVNSYSLIFNLRLLAHDASEPVEQLLAATGKGHGNFVDTVHHSRRGARRPIQQIRAMFQQEIRIGCRPGEHKRTGRHGRHRQTLGWNDRVEREVADGLNGSGPAIGAAEANVGEVCSVQQIRQRTKRVVGGVSGGGRGISQRYRQIAIGKRQLKFDRIAAVKKTDPVGP